MTDRRITLAGLLDQRRLSGRGCGGGDLAGISAAGRVAAGPPRACRCRRHGDRQRPAVLRRDPFRRSADERHSFAAPRSGRSLAGRRSRVSAWLAALTPLALAGATRLSGWSRRRGRRGFLAAARRPRTAPAAGPGRLRRGHRAGALGVGLVIAHARRRSARRRGMGPPEACSRLAQRLRLPVAGHRGHADPSGTDGRGHPDRAAPERPGGAGRAGHGGATGRARAGARR